MMLYIMRSIMGRHPVDVGAWQWVIHDAIGAIVALHHDGEGRLSITIDQSGRASIPVAG